MQQKLGAASHPIGYQLAVGPNLPNETAVGKGGGAVGVDTAVVATTAAHATVAASSATDTIAATLPAVSAVIHSADAIAATETAARNGGLSM